MQSPLPVKKAGGFVIKMREASLYVPRGEVRQSG